MPLIWFALVAVLLLAFPARAASMYDPDTRWRTLETAHFRVNFPEGLEVLARRVATFAEDAHGKLTVWFGTVPTARTELTILDDQDTPNGFAFPYPNNQIFITAASPDEEEALSEGYGRYDDALRARIVHEYAHVLQMETTGGLVAAIDTVFGRVMYPNLTQPLFLIEGLAVGAETRFGGSSRADAAGYEMVLRAMALEDKLIDVDQTGAFLADMWPHNGAYVFGTFFYKYLESHYGADAPRKIAVVYGSEPWFGIDEAFRKAVGRDLHQVWDEFARHIKERYRRQERQLRERPLTPYSLVTSGGRYHRHPRFLPDGRLVYGEYTGATWSVAKAITPGPGARFDASTAADEIAMSPFGSWSVTADGRFAFFALTTRPDPFHAYSEIYRHDFRTRDRVRLTRLQRATDPAVAPDGGEVMAVLGGRGQNDLAVFDAGGTLLRRLTRNEDHEQYSGLQWSPDGSQVALSAWKAGWRDLYLVDPATGSQTPLWRDAATDINPAWTPDGRYLLFASDRSGVFNLHAVRLADRRVFQVSHVLTGAFEPAVSPDMRTIAFSVYTAAGYEIATMSFQPETWQPAAERLLAARAPDGGFVMVDPATPDIAGVAPATGDAAPYNPWISLRPKAWVPNVYLPDEAGPGLGLSLYSTDTLLRHQLSASLGVGIASRRPQYTLSYVNDQLLPTISVFAADYANDFVVPSPIDPAKTVRTWRQQVQQGASVTYPGIPNRLLGQLFVTGDFVTLGYSRLESRDLGTAVPADCGGQVPRLANSPLAATAEVEGRCLGRPGAILGSAGVPAAGLTSVVSLGYKHADHYRFARSISAEGGTLFALDYDKASPLWGSQAAFDRVTADLRTHVAGFAPRHVWAFRALAGANLGGRDGGFNLGGNLTTSLLDIIDVRALGAFRHVPLRGYPSKSGDRVAALNVEYRFPLGEIGRSIGTLPVFIDRWYGAFLYDIGNVWTGAYEPDNLKQAVGISLRAKVDVLHVPVELGIGLAQGTSPLGLANDIPPNDRRPGSWMLGERLLPPPEVLLQIGTTF
ncbi:MAG: PD40 domain-containing protein [Candidatus Sericytochromatia bacterium]|nr:PD40 domain-containing protein [Candidatus Tanganyikabacteria bacterium]